MKRAGYLILIFLCAISLFAFEPLLPEIDSDDLIVTREYYTLSYSEYHEQAEWVAYELTRNEVLGQFERTDNFRADPAVSTGSASLADYRGSGYDRGHLAPAADMKISDLAMRDSFYMSNMSPQDPSFNRGIWKKLEAIVRQMAYDNGAIHVVTGPVLNRGNFQTIGPNRVSVPEFYYKIILDYREPELKAIGFILPNEKSSISLNSFAVTVDEVERVTGIDFYVALVVTI